MEARLARVETEEMKFEDWPFVLAVFSLLLNFGLVIDRYFIEFDRMVARLKKKVEKDKRCPLCGSMAHWQD
jgi:hypothetical protein